MTPYQRGTIKQFRWHPPVHWCQPPDHTPICYVLDHGQLVPLLNPAGGLGDMP